MAITLAQAKVNRNNKVDQQVIDSFRRGSFLLDGMVFDNTVSPGSGGSTLVYGYERLITPAKAGFRAINSEYTSSEAIREPKTATLKIFGGSFNLDRVIIDTAGAADELAFQANQKIKSAIALFNYAVINGNSSTAVTQFDGLDVSLVGTDTEHNTDAVIDLSDSAAVDTNYKTFLDALEEWLAEFDGKPNAIMGNSKMITKIKQVARRAGYLTHSEDAFGRKVDAYDGIALVDLGNYVNDSGILVPAVGVFDDREPDGETTVTGLTDLYAARFGLDAFHGATVTGDKIVRTYMPDLNGPGAVKTGEVEMIAAPVLKSTRAAGVFRNIKIK